MRVCYRNCGLKAARFFSDFSTSVTRSRLGMQHLARCTDTNRQRSSQSQMASAACGYLQVSSSSCRVFFYLTAISSGFTLSSLVRNTQLFGHFIALFGAQVTNPYRLIAHQVQGCFQNFRPAGRLPTAGLFFGVAETPDSLTRSSATAERQRVSYTRLSRLTH